MLKLHQGALNCSGGLPQHGKGLSILKICKKDKPSGYYCFLFNVDRWVFHFAHLRQLPVLVPYIPTENPRLNDTAYEVVIKFFFLVPTNFYQVDFPLNWLTVRVLMQNMLFFFSG
jgi:hypothetical protein